MTGVSRLWRYDPRIPKRERAWRTACMGGRSRSHYHPVGLRSIETREPPCTSDLRSDYCRGTANDQFAVHENFPVKGRNLTLRTRRLHSPNQTLALLLSLRLCANGHSGGGNFLSEVM